MADAQVLHAQKIDNPTSANTTWVDAATISAASFTANKEYLLICICDVSGSGASTEKGMRVVHGSTPTVFDDATTSMDVAATGEKLSVGWLFRFSQPGTVEDVKIQFNRSGGSGTVTHEYSTIIAMKLSDDLVENTDYYWNEALTDTADAASMTSRASVTFTPNGTDTWFIIGQASWDVAAASEFSMRLHDSVGPVDYGDEDASKGYNAQDTATDLFNMLFGVGVVPSNAAHTFSVQTISSTSDTVRSSRIFALNLNKFAQRAVVYNSAADTPGAVMWETEATVSPTPNATGNWVIFANAIVTSVSTDDVFGRLQINASGAGLASDPAYGDDAPDQISASNTRGLHFTLVTVKQLSLGAARDINFDFIGAVANAGSVKGRALVAFSVALADVISQPPQPEFAQVDEIYDEEHADSYAGWMMWLMPEDVIILDQIWAEIPIIDKTYEEEHDHGGFLQSPLADDNDVSAARVEFPVLDESYDKEHDYAGFSAWQVPENVEDFQALAELLTIDESYDEEHDYSGFSAWQVPENVEDFQVLAELPSIDETFDEQHDYSGFSTWQAPENVEDFQALVELPGIDESYEEEYDYAGFAVWQIAAENIEDFQPLAELPTIDETYDAEHDYAGYSTWQTASDIVDFQPIPELAQIDETYDEGADHEFNGFVFWLVPDSVEDALLGAAEFPQVDESYELVAEFFGWQTVIIEEPVVEEPVILPEIPQIELYDESYFEYSGWQHATIETANVLFGGAVLDGVRHDQLIGKKTDQVIGVKTKQLRR